jgi:hypothetical protein
VDKVAERQPAPAPKCSFESKPSKSSSWRSSWLGSRPLQSGFLHETLPMTRKSFVPLWGSTSTTFDHDSSEASFCFA